jgi:hypothetical protein
MGVETSTFLRVYKAMRQSSSKLNGVSLARRLVKGLAIWEKSLLNLLKKPVCPRKLQTPLTFVGGGNC